MPTNWRVYQRETVAARLEAADIPGFLRKQVVVGPNEAAIVVRQGVPGEVLTESSIKVAGVFDKVKSWFGAGSDLSVYFIDLAPFDVTLFLGETTSETAAVSRGSVSSVATGSGGPTKTLDLVKSATPFGWAAGEDVWTQQSGTSTSREEFSRITVVALSSDREVVQACCHIRLSVNLDLPNPLDGVVPLLALLKGKRALASWDIAALLRDEVVAKVLVPEIAQFPASGLRSDKSLLERLESQSREVLARSLANCGLELERFMITWGLTESERAEIAQQRATREEKALEFAKTRRIAHLHREQEVEKLHLQNLQELKVAQTRGDQDLKNILLSGDLERERLVANNEVDLAQVEAKIRDITLAVEKKESLARLEERRAQDELRLDIEDREAKQKHAARLLSLDASDKEMWSMVKMQIEMANQKHDREMARRRQEIDSEFRRIFSRFSPKRFISRFVKRSWTSKTRESCWARGTRAARPVLGLNSERSSAVFRKRPNDSRLARRSSTNFTGSASSHATSSFSRTSRNSTTVCLTPSPSRKRTACFNPSKFGECCSRSEEHLQRCSSWRDWSPSPPSQWESGSCLCC